MTQEGDQTPLSQAPGDPLPPRSPNLKGVTTPLRFEYAPTCFDEKNKVYLVVLGAALRRKFRDCAGSSRMSWGVVPPCFSGWSPGQFSESGALMPIRRARPRVRDWSPGQFLGWSPGARLWDVTLPHSSV